MVIKVELGGIDDLRLCEDFINDFIKDKKIKKINVCPMIKGEDVSYFYCIEYELDVEGKVTGQLDFV